MILKIRLFAFLCFLGNFFVLHASSGPTEPVTLPSIPMMADDDVCNLQSPAYLNVLEVGTSWVKLGWASVPGAMRYHIVTKEANSGNVIRNDIAAGTDITRTITGLAPGIYFFEITSMCQNDQESTPPALSPNTGVIVIDIVTASLILNKSSLRDDNCILPTTPDYCTILNSNGGQTIFKISAPQNGASIFFKTTKDAVGVHVSPDTEPANSPYYFQNDNGENIYIRWGGPNGVALAHISTSMPDVYTRGLYRLDDNQNVPSFQITRWTYSGFTDPGDREIEQESVAPDGKHLIATPNPFSGHLDIKIPFSSEETDVTINLYDLQGRLVLSQQTQGGPQIRSLSTEDLIPGLYLLRVDTGDRSETIKVVKTQ